MLRVSSDQRIAFALGIGRSAIKDRFASGIRCVMRCVSVRSHFGPSVERQIMATLGEHGIKTHMSVSIPAADYGAKALDHVLAGTLSDEIAKAVEYVKKNVDKDPRGIACPTRSPEQIRTLMTASPDGSIMASGSLRMMVVEGNAVNTLDAARIKRMLNECDTLAAFKKAIGPIKINFDTSDHSDIARSDRLNKDGEIHALCLLIYWMKNEHVTAAGADLIFEYTHGGVGSRAATSALRLVNEEEASRKAATVVNL